MKFLVVSNAPVFKEDGIFSAYAPYVNEMDLWFKNVEQIGIISPSNYPEDVFKKAFKIQNIKYFKIPFFKLITFFDAIWFVIISPIVLFKLVKSFIWADHIHLRCPGNLGLLGSFIQIFFPHKKKTVKYAGNWDPDASQPWSYRLQKGILENPSLSKNMTVMVYGEWPGQTKNILSAFTASFSKNDRMILNKDFLMPYKFLFVGALVEGKRPLLAIQIVESLHRKGYPVSLEIYGQGILGSTLKEYVQRKNLSKTIKFNGVKELKELQQVYLNSHFLILASKSEGWPKVIAEAMFFGCIPIATPVSCVRWMLDNGKRGILIKNEILSAVKKVEIILKKPEELQNISMAAKKWSHNYTIEHFEAQIKSLI